MVSPTLGLVDRTRPRASSGSQYSVLLLATAMASKIRTAPKKPAKTTATRDPASAGARACACRQSRARNFSMPSMALPAVDCTAPALMAPLAASRLAGLAGGDTADEPIDVEDQEEPRVEAMDALA